MPRRRKANNEPVEDPRSAQPASPWPAISTTEGTSSASRMSREASGTRFAREGEDAFGDDVLVPLGGPAGDGHRAGAEDAVGPRTFERGHAEDVDRGVGHRLGGLGPGQLHHAAL